MRFLTQPVVIALLVPFTFLIIGGVAKKLVRGSSWQPEDFYLGIEASLAALSFGVGYLFELAKEATIQATLNPICIATKLNMVEKVIFTALFLTICFGLLFLVMAEHQEWQLQESTKNKNFRLLGACNVVGCGLLFVFILWVKGV